MMISLRENCAWIVIRFLLCGFLFSPPFFSSLFFSSSILPFSYVAYLLVHSLAILSCSSRFCVYWVAILPTSGSAERIARRLGLTLMISDRKNPFPTGQRGSRYKSRTDFLPGLQSVRSEHTDKRTLETVSAGLQLSLRMSRQMTPWLLMLQW